jgi:hypothetical protein
MMDWTTSPDQMWPDRLETTNKTLNRRGEKRAPACRRHRWNSRRQLASLGGFCMQHMICHPGFGEH